MNTKSAELRKVVRIKDYLASKGLYIRYEKPFRCINPSHEDKHPSCFVYNNPDADHIHCYSCGLHGDIFLVVGIMERITDGKEKFKFLMKNYGHRI